MNTFSFITAFLLSALLSQTTQASVVSFQNVAEHDTLRPGKLSQKIAKQKVYFLDDNDPGQQKLLEDLSRSGSTFDLMKTAMTSKSPMVRLFSFRAVAGQMDALPGELIDKFRNDSTLIKTEVLGKIRDIPLNRIANGFLP